MYSVNVTIEGISPLLFNRFIQAELEGKSKKASGADKEKQVEDKLYLVDGKIYTPSSHLEGSLVNAGKNFKVKGKGKSTYSKLAGSVISVNPDAIIHKNQAWDVFRNTAVNPNTKGRMLVERPKMDKWGLDFKIDVADDGLPMEVLKEMLDFAGQYVGIGDWRPDKKGKFGKFIVTQFNKVT